MDALLALGPLAAALAAIGAIALVADRLLGDTPTGLPTLFRIELDPPWPRGVQEEEPLRWNVQRLTRPTRGADGRPAAAKPVPGGLKVAGSS